MGGMNAHAIVLLSEHLKPISVKRRLSRRGLALEGTHERVTMIHLWSRSVAKAPQPMIDTVQL